MYGTGLAGSEMYASYAADDCGFSVGALNERPKPDVR